MSRLFQLANQLARSVRPGRSPRSLARDQQTRRMIEGVAAETGYSAEAVRTTGRILDALGVAGEAIKSALGIRGKAKSLSRKQLKGALDLLGIVSPKSRRRELPVSEEVGRALQELTRPKPPPLPAKPQTAGGKRPPPLPPRIGGMEDDDEPPEHDIRLSGRGSMGYDDQGMRELIGREILTPGSSNVYSFVFEAEDAKQGILYVTFKAWHPGSKGKRNAPGPTYAYYDVPLRKYKAFASMASTTAGGAVWDYLRVRGSKWDHRHPYRLVAGSLVPAGGEYVPRKATRGGMRKRALPKMGTGRRGFVTSALPEQRPNRGRPNRGSPNRGRP